MIKMSHCEIIKIEDQESTFTPKIVNFQNGQPHDTKKLETKSFSDPKTNKTIVAVASDRLTYVGEENNDNLYYTLLAFRNKKTNKVRIVPVNTVSTNVCMSQTNELLNTTLNSKIKVGDLYKQFGSKKNKRRTEQHERMKMNISEVEEELKSAVANVVVKEAELVTQEVDENVADYRPNINRNASKVENVYDLYSIIKQEELNSLKDIASGIVKNSVIDEQLSIFAHDCITKLKQSSVQDLKKYEIILYCDAILKFFKISTRDLKKKVQKIPPYPEIIVNKILKEYTVFSGNSRLRPVTMRDKGVCFVIVLALIAMDYKIDLEILVKSINVGIKKLCEISRILGAQSLSSSCKNNIVLKLPLPPPVTGFRKANRKK